MASFLTRLLHKNLRSPDTKHVKVDLSKLDSSLGLLKAASIEVSQAAALAAKAIEESKEEHKRNKACFTALNSATDTIVILDKDHKVFFCNDMFLRTFDVDHYDDIVGHDINSCIPGICTDEIWNVVSSNQTWTSKYGNQETMTIIPMMDDEPTPIYYICTIKSNVRDE